MMLSFEEESLYKNIIPSYNVGFLVQSQKLNKSKQHNCFPKLNIFLSLS